MRLIEFIGTAGSGKSTVLDLVVADAGNAGIHLHRMSTATRVAVARGNGDPLASLTARTVARYFPRLWKSVLTRSSNQVAVLSRAIATQPKLVATIIKANATHNDDADPEAVMEMLLNHLIRYQIADEALGEDDWLVLGEGLSHRVISLFAAASKHKKKTLDRYLELVPVPDVLVRIDTPVDQCYARLEKASWTPRIADKPPAHRRQFLERSRHLVDHAVSLMQSAGAVVVTVDNTTDPSDDIPAVIEALRAAGDRATSQPRHP